MSNLINFTFENLPVRIIDLDNNHWFIANDVCNILEIQNTTDALKALDDDEKTKLEVSPSFNLGVHKGVKEINIINESGLYALILRSRKAMQKGTVQHQFRKWVTSEVLPSIRKNGSYSTKLTNEQQRELANKVRSVCKGNKKHYPAVWNTLKDHFHVERYTEIESKDFNEAMALIEVVELPQAIEHQQFNIGDYLNRQANQVMDYVHDLELIVFNTTGKYPQRPFSKDEIAKGIIGHCLINQSIELSFSERGLGFNLIDRTTLRIHDSNIAEHIKIGNVSKQYLDDIIQASVRRLA